MLVTTRSSRDASFPSTVKHQPTTRTSKHDGRTPIRSHYSQIRRRFGRCGRTLHQLHAVPEPNHLDPRRLCAASRIQYLGNMVEHRVPVAEFGHHPPRAETRGTTTLSLMSANDTDDLPGHPIGRHIRLRAYHDRAGRSLCAGRELEASASTVQESIRVLFASHPKQREHYSCLSRC